MERLSDTRRPDPRVILVFAPNPVGDAVMATPAIAALRRRYAGAKIAVLARPHLKELFLGLDFVDEVRGLEGLKAGVSVSTFLAGARALKTEGCELAVLLANSFRTAAFAWLAGAKRRVGYAREWRRPLLTDALKAPKGSEGYVPAPMIDYYLGLASYLGAPVDDRRMRIVATEEDRRAASGILSQFGVDGRRPIAVVNPGAAFGAAKCWPAANFASVAGALQARGFEVIVATSPRERQVGEEIGRQAVPALKPAWRADIPLGALKGLLARAAVLVTNDSGPRHIGAALNVPVVTIIGPTDPKWSDTGYRREVVLRKEVECAPCMLRVCPKDHRCMELITPGEVVAAVDALVGNVRVSEGVPK